MKINDSFDLSYLYEDAAPMAEVIEFPTERAAHPDNQNEVLLPNAKTMVRLRAKMGERYEPFMAWIAALQENTNAHYAERFPNIGGDQVSFEVGRRYVRVIKHHGNGQTFVHVFVEMETGLLWKPDGYKHPTRNFSRGNIADIKTAAFRYGF